MSQSRPRGRGLPHAVASSGLAAALVLGGCSSTRPSSVAGIVVRVTERDFHISASPTQIPAGDVVLRVHNQGPENHELLVVRAASSALPLRTDGVTADEDRLEPVKVGGLEPGVAGSVRELRLRLAPGRYEMFCNMAGHYLGGMHVELMVSR